jgi:plasmid stability protein
LTLNLPEELIKKAKVYAAQHDTSVNALMKQLLQERLDQEDPYKAAGRRFLEIVSRGPFVDIDPGTIKREDLYDRR